MGITKQVVSFGVMFKKLDQRTSGLDDFARKPMHFDVLVIADEKPLRCVEHDEALHHIVERRGEMFV
jgi:hypothetical protein